jgi:hypothetical protein
LAGVRSAERGGTEGCAERQGDLKGGNDEEADRRSGGYSSARSPVVGWAAVSRGTGCRHSCSLWTMVIDCDADDDFMPTCTDNIVWRSHTGIARTASGLVGGQPARVVMDMLGHARLAITTDLYSHVMPTAFT